MSDIINLNKARKNRMREREKSEAAQNRITFGLPGHVRRAAREEEKRKTGQLEGQRLPGADKSENS